MNIQKLQLENADLKRKLQIAQAWMEREVRIQVEQIWNKHNQDWGNHTELSQEKIIETITEFIWEILMLNVPGDFMENIISAEVLFHSLEENKNFDGMWIISSYHKALDVLIENFITKGFRKFAHKQKQTQLRKNDVMEKTLNSVINQWYILWVWRFYHILKMIRSWEVLEDYAQCFKDYILKYNYLWDMFLSDEFYWEFWKLINSEILWKKRHVWNINLEETAKARKILIWNFEDTNCLIYKMIETQKIEC